MKLLSLGLLLAATSSVMAMENVTEYQEAPIYQAATSFVMAMENSAENKEVDIDAIIHVAQYDKDSYFSRNTPTHTTKFILPVYSNAKLIDKRMVSDIVFHDLLAKNLLTAESFKQPELHLENLVNLEYLLREPKEKINLHQLFSVDTGDSEIDDMGAKLANNIFETQENIAAFRTLPDNVQISTAVAFSKLACAVAGHRKGNLNTDAFDSRLKALLSGDVTADFSVDSLISF